MSSDARDGALTLLLESLSALGDVRRPLLIGDANAALVAAFRASGAEPRVWVRTAAAGGSGGEAPRTWPEGDGFDAAVIRLPKSKDSLTMALHAAAAKTPPGSAIAVYGANAEGVRSATSRLSAVADDVETVSIGHHARLLVGRRREAIAGLKGRLEDWRQVATIELDGSVQPWVSYPGTFAKGGLDDGTAFLIAHLPTPARNSRVLDFAAGTGVIAAALLRRCEALTIDMIEADALAVAAARENVPSARGIVGTGLGACGAQRFDLIVSNPPIHDGVAESHRVLERLIADAPNHLRASGKLVLVVQRRVAVLPLMEKVLASVHTLADDGRFTVVSGERAAHAR